MISGARLPAVEVVREPDGAILLCHSRPDVPLVSVQVQCPGGRMREPAASPGLAELAGELLSEGPAGMAPLDWRRKLENLAAEMDCQARVDDWAAGCDCLADDLGAVAGLFGDLLRRPGLPESEWKRIVKGHRAAEREEWAQPMSVIGRLAAVQALGFAHPGARPDFEAAFARAKFAEARELGAGALRRGGELYATIGGAISPEEGFRRLREILAALPVGAQALPAEPEPRPSRAPVWLADHPGIDQAFFALTRPGIRAGDADRVALRLANYIIGGGSFASRLMTRVREDLGHTYGINSRAPERRQAAPFTIRSFTRAGNLGAMLDLIARVLREVVEGGFTDAEVADARGHDHGALPLAMTSPRAVLDRAVGGLRAGLAPETLEADWRSIPETPRAKVEAAARRLIGDGRFRLAVIGPARQLRPQLAARGEIAVFKFKTPPDRWPAGPRALHPMARD